MKRLKFFVAKLMIPCLFLLLISPLTARSEPSQSGPPPIAQEMVREGDFALKLAPALGLGSPEDEIEAETMLGSVGIAPRNGWIADYPVTPDVIGELYKSVRDAAASERIDMDVAEALKILDAVNSEAGVMVTPSTITTGDGTKIPQPGGSPDQTVINNYYNTQGPPVVTYYAPPQDYYYMYSWVPYPFWWFGFWYPGYFILNDFHRVVHVHNRAVFVSNHFRDLHGNRVFRIDPVRRFNGRTFVGIGVTRSRDFISTGVPRGERRIFNAPRTRVSPVLRSPATSSHGSGRGGDGGGSRGRGRR